MRRRCLYCDYVIPATWKKEEIFEDLLNHEKAHELERRLHAN